MPTYADCCGWVISIIAGRFEVIADTLAKKGQGVIIEGQLRRNNWESEDGQKHSKHFLKAESWQFTQYRRQEESTEAAPKKGAKETKKAASKDTG